VRHEQASSFLHEALAVTVVLIEVGVVVAGDGAVHAASAGGLGRAYGTTGDKPDLVADTVRHPERNHLRQPKTRTRKASSTALFKQNHYLGALRTHYTNLALNWSLALNWAEPTSD
jgi:hypothetical protein